MTKSLFYSIIFHATMIVLTALSLPFMTREPISLPPIVSVELIQITDKTNIPFAPKARKIIDKVKKEIVKGLKKVGVIVVTSKGITKKGISKVFWLRRF